MGRFKFGFKVSNRSKQNDDKTHTSARFANTRGYKCYTAWHCVILV